MSSHYSYPHGHVFYRKMNRSRPRISHGDGVYLFDSDGKRYLDGAGGPFVVNVGHGRREIVDAIAAQASAVGYVHATMFTGDVLEQYADDLALIVPLDDPRFFFLTSGSEVIEGAIKLARQIQISRGETFRSRIISRRQSYHGMSLGALSISGRESLRQPYLPMLSEVVHVSPPYPYRDTRTGTDYAAELEQTIQQVGAEQVAAFVAEPISGAGLGACLPPEDYWSAIRDVCSRYGVLLIVDEVFTGMGRTGQWWGIDHWNVQPDILVTSKGIAGGYFPLGMIAVDQTSVEQIQKTLGDFNHGGTFSHHLVGAAAGRATLEILQTEKLVERSAHMGALLGEKLHLTFGEHYNIGEIRGTGLCWGLEFVRDRKSKNPFLRADRIAPRLWEAAFDRGLSLYYSQGCANGHDGDVLLIGPPFIITESQIDEMIEIIAAAIDDVLG